MAHRPTAPAVTQALAVDLWGKLQTCNVQSALYLIALEPVQPQIRGDPTGDFCHIDIKQLFVFGALLFAGEHHHL